MRRPGASAGGSRTSRLAWQGALLFSFIPFVLYLYLRQPLGPAVSLGLGLVVMFAHRFAASPWVERNASARCLWCARGGELQEIEIAASGRAWKLRACGSVHRDRIARFLTFVTRFRVAIGLGIFAPLIVLLLGTLLIAAGRPVIPHEWNSLQFRMIVATTVVGTSFGYLGVGEADRRLSCPFPLHNLFLLGVGATLWVFRVVGLWWLASSLLQLSRL